MAFSPGFTAWMRSRCARMTSTAESSREAIACTRSRALHQCRGSATRGACRIRSLRPVSCDEIIALTLGHEFTPRRLSLEGGGDERLRLPIIALLVHGDGGRALLDTGISPAFRDDALAEAIYRGRGPEIPGDGHPLLAALDAAGLSVGDLAVAAVSHLHVDHTGGLGCSPAGRPLSSSGASWPSRAPRPPPMRRTCPATTPIRRSPGASSTATGSSHPASTRCRRPATRPGTCPTVCGWTTERRGCSPWTPSTCRRASTPTRRSAGRLSRTTHPCAAHRTTASSRSPPPRARG